MSQGFDAYYRWLSIPPDEQPPNHYRLLGLKLFEADSDVIESAADRQMAHVRVHQSGDHADLTQKLLNEIATAKICLLDPQRKTDYDATLQSRQEPNASALPQARPLAESAESPQPAKAADAPMPPGKPLPASDKRSVSGAGAAIVLVVLGAGALVLLLGLFGIGGLFFFMAKSDVPVANTQVAIDAPSPTDDLPADTNPQPASEVTPPNVAPGDNAPNISSPPPRQNTDLPDIDPDPIPVRNDPPIENRPTPPDSHDTTKPASVSTAPAPAPQPVDNRLPVPGEAERASKQKEIKEVFPVDDVRDLKAKQQLAERMLKTGLGTLDDPQAQFVLFNLSREMACEAGDMATAFQAVDELNRRFKIEPQAVRVASVETAAQAAIPSTAKKKVIESGVTLVDELFEVDEYIVAAGLINTLLDAARKIRSREQITELADLRTRGSSMYREYQKAKEAFNTLAENPDDAQANAIAGAYYCFIKGNWQRGLPLLAKGTDGPLKEAAQQELAIPKTADQRVVLADQWWELGEKTDGPLGQTKLARAGMWYGRAVGSLTGLSKIKVQRRIDEMAKLSISGGQPYSPVVVATNQPVVSTPKVEDPKPLPRADAAVELLPLVDTAQDAVNGDWRRVGGQLVSPDTKLARIQIPCIPPEEYVLDIEVTPRDSGPIELLVGMIASGRQFTAVLEGFNESGGKSVSGLGDVDRKRPPTNITAHRGRFARPGERNLVRCEVRDSLVRVTVNDEEVIEFKGEHDRLSNSIWGRVKDTRVLFLGAHGNPLIFHSVKITPIAGEMELLRDSPSPDPDPKPDRPAPPDISRGPGDLKLHVTAQPARPGPVGKQGSLNHLNKNVDVATDGIEGEWQKNGQTIVVDAKEKATLFVPYSPPEEYMFGIKVTRLAGTGPLVLNLPIRGQACTLIVDAEKGKGTVWAAGHDLRSKSDVQRRGEQCLPVGESVMLYCDTRKPDVEIRRNSSPYLKLAGWPAWTGVIEPWTPPRPDGFCVMCRDAKFQIEATHVTPWGRGEDLRGELGVKAVRIRPMDSDLDVLAHVREGEDAVKGDWSFKGKSLVSPKGHGQLLRLPCKPPSQYRLDVEVTRVEGDRELVFNIPIDGGGTTLAFDSGNTSRWQVAPRGGGGYPTYEGKLLEQGRRAKISVVVSDQGYQAHVNGRKVLGVDGRWGSKGGGGTWDPKPSIFLAVGSSHTTFHIHSVKLTPLGEGGTLLRDPMARRD